MSLTGLGAPGSIGLSFASSRVGMYGIDTPTYVAVDQLALTPEPSAVGLALLTMFAPLSRRRRRLR